MRKFVIITFLFLSNISLSYSNTLVGNIKKCEVAEQNHNTHILKLFQEGKLIKDNIKSGYLGEFKIENIEKGNYVLEYENIFGQIIKRKVEIIKDLEKIELCLDTILASSISTIFNSLKDKDCLILKYSTSGCFHQFENELTFSRVGSNFFVEKIKQNGKKIKRSVSIEKLNYLIEFEKKLRLIDKVDAFCTTNDFYDFNLNGRSIFKASDGTCDWNGFNLIEEKLFPK